MSNELGNFLREMDAKATAGPWSGEDPCDGCCGHACTPDGCHETHATGEHMLIGPEQEPWARFDNANDVPLIVSLRNGLPALIALLDAELEVIDYPPHPEFAEKAAQRVQMLALRREAFLAALKDQP